MKNKRLRLSGLFVLLMLFVSLSVPGMVFAAELNAAEIRFDSYPPYSMPAGLNVVSVPNVMDWLQKMEKLIPPPLRDEMMKYLPVQGSAEDWPFVMGVHQLTHFDRKDYRQAYILSFRLKSPYAELFPYVKGKPDETKLKFAQSLNSQIQQNLVGLSYMDPATKTGGKVLEVQQVKLFPVNDDRTAYAFGVRYLLQYQGFQQPLPVQAYVTTDAEAIPSILVLVMTDSERKFWTKLMDKMLGIPKK